MVDGGKARILLAALVTPADVMENVPLRDLLWRVCFRRKLRPRQVTGDTTYGTTENIVALEDAGIRAFFPLPDFDRRTALLSARARSPTTLSGTRTAARRDNRCHVATTKYTEEEVVYRADAATCNACSVKTKCTASDRGRIVHRSFFAAYFEKVRGYHTTEVYKKAMRKRQVWVEPLFAEAKDWHGLRRLRLRWLGEREHPGVADRCWAEPEALACHHWVGAATCPVRKPLGPPAGAKAALGHLWVMTHLAGDPTHRRTDLAWPEMPTPTTGGFFQRPVLRCDAALHDVLHS